MNINDKGLRNKINIDPSAKIDASTYISFTGNDNTFTIGMGCILEGAEFYFQGNGHTAILGNNVEMHKGCMAFENDDNIFQVGDRTKIFGGYQIAVGEPKRKIIIGSDCLCSWSVRMRTTDSHSIWDLTTNQRINKGKSIIIGDRVWMGEAIQILKGTCIQNDSVVGTGSIVTGKTFPPNSIIAGNPAKVVKSNIYWKVLREDD